MDLNLIKKLVRLANKNPNEHEANAAARKVCKLIEEGKFDFGNTRQSFNWSDDFLYEFLKKSKGPAYKNTSSDWVYPPTDYETRSNVKRKLTCSKCKEAKETRFRGAADIWVCMECRGKAYQKETK